MTASAPLASKLSALLAARVVPVLRYTDDVVRNVKASDKTLKAVQAFLTPGAVVELTLTIGYYMMVCRLLETTGVEGEEGQAEWLKTAKL